MINWSMPGPQNNALAYFQMGNELGGQFRERQRREQDEKAVSGALSAIVANPKMDDATFSDMVRNLPGNAGIRFVEMRRNAQIADQEASGRAAERKRADLPLLTRLIENSTDEASYQANRTTAQEYGVDVSGIPAQFDPQWRDKQLATLRALQTPEGQQALSAAGKTAQDMGFKPGTPEFNQRVTEIYLAGESKPYTVAGDTRLYTPRFSSDAPPKPQIIPQKPAGLTDDQIWSQAHEAVRNGANADDVFRQLEAWGMKP